MSTMANPSNVRIPRFTPLPTSIHTLVESTPNAILLETSRYDATNHHSYLFLNPARILTATTPDEIPTLFAQIEAALDEGLHIAGYLSYECAAHFEPSTSRVPHSYAHLRTGGEARTLDPDAPPLAFLGAYPAPIVFDHTTGNFVTRVPHSYAHLRTGGEARTLDPDALPVAYLGAHPEPHTTPILTNPTLRIPTSDYLSAIEQIKAYIAAGDTYQVNFTDAVTFPTSLSPATLFTALSEHQSVAYAAFLNLPSHQSLSLSPELFFRIDSQTDKITTRPMKGTMPRGLDTTEDKLAALALQHDEKNRAEHVMIVDLLRNDLGRICTPGSVRVDDLFSIERYQTLHQMTSTISGTLRPRLSFYDIFAAMFPCGSITGAPKIRTMQIIRELESHPRGIYTGAIGHIAPDRSATFNVAIRTLVLRNGQAHMGVGGGIVADSIPEDEHREALLKASFLTRTVQPFELIETILFDQHYVRLPLHLDRLEASAQYFDFACDRTSVEAQLHQFSLSLDPAQRHRVRILLAPTGTVTLTSQPLGTDPAAITVTLSPHRTLSTDPFLRHKTTNRQLYNDELAHARAEGFDEVIFLNERNELTEGAITNLFVEQSGRLLTPPLSSGVLPGILRRHLLETHPAIEERILTLADLHPPNTLWLGNSLRGLRKATLRSTS